MISGEYNAVQAYQSFNTQLEESPISEKYSAGATENIFQYLSYQRGMKRILLWQTLL